jgi:hypothetical protein
MSSGAVPNDLCFTGGENEKYVQSGRSYASCLSGCHCLQLSGLHNYQSYNGGNPEHDADGTV